MDEEQNLHGFQYNNLVNDEACIVVYGCTYSAICSVAEKNGLESYGVFNKFINCS